MEQSSKKTKADLERDLYEAEQKLARIRRLALLRAVRNDLRGGANVHTANAYRLIVKWIDNPDEYARSLDEMATWVATGLRV